MDAYGRREDQGAQRLSASKVLSRRVAQMPDDVERSAQRLSASKVLSPANPICPPSSSAKCSTPFGIKGSLTLVSPQSSRFLRVLNAFRHQRFSHFGCGRAGSIALQDVLNAFRHQRFSHQGGPRTYLSAQHVLNAFRHQRFSHTEREGMMLIVLLCSTPFGIKGSLTSGPSCPLGQVEVLNAFRHQRFSHPQPL